MGWMLVLGLKAGLVECATVWVKSEVILICVVAQDNDMENYVILRGQTSD
jgi:hypothetical protein